MANYWQGQFPYLSSKDDQQLRTTPVGSFPDNDFGIVNMIGNVWEWTSDFYNDGMSLVSENSCCVPSNPRGGSEAGSINLASGFPRKVLKGGSYLCAPNYCQRYRPASRYAQMIDTSTSHIGFRCAMDVPAQESEYAAASCSMMLVSNASSTATTSA